MKSARLIGGLLIGLVCFLILSAPAQAECTVQFSSPYWPSGGKKVGERMDLAVTVQTSGCAGEMQVLFQVYDEDTGPDDFIKELSVPLRSGTLTTSSVFTTTDYQAGGGDAGEGELELYFIAKACVGSVCAAQTQSGIVTLSPESFSDDQDPNKCKLSAPYWPSGSKRVGEQIEMSVASTGCPAGFTVLFRVFDEDTGGIGSFIKEVKVPAAAGTTRARTFISSSEFEAAGGGVTNSSEGELEVFFTAEPCNALSQCGNGLDPNGVVTSSIITVSGDLGTPATPGAPPGSSTTTGGGKNVSYSFKITNPFKADDLTGLVGAIGTWIFNISIPVAVIVIIWAGLRMLWARGDAKEFGAAKDMLKYAVIGLVIIFIGRGFISLVQSILSLADPAGTTTTQPQSPQTPTQPQSPPPAAVPAASPASPAPQLPFPVL